MEFATITIRRPGEEPVLLKVWTVCQAKRALRIARMQGLLTLQERLRILKGLAEHKSQPGEFAAEEMLETEAQLNQLELPRFQLRSQNIAA